MENNVLLIGAAAVIGLAAAIGFGIAAFGGDTAAPPGSSVPGSSLPGSSLPDASILPADPPDAGADPSVSESLIAVKVDNAPEARPQIGLNAARFIVEAPVEGGITRFLAVFAEGDQLVGPVRSVRPVDVDLVPALATTLVSTGGRPFVVGPLAANGTVLIGADPDGPNPFQRLERPAPHDLFVALGDITPDPVEVGFPGGSLPDGAPDAAAIEVPYPVPVTWDHVDGTYVRSEGGEPAQVMAGYETDPEPFTSDTVVVMSVGKRLAGYQDVNGAEVPTFDVIGSGRVFVFSAGTVVEGAWTRASLADGYVFRTADGTEFGLPEGRTFIHLLNRELAPTW